MRRQKRVSNDARDGDWPQDTDGGGSDKDEKEDSNPKLPTAEEKSQRLTSFRVRTMSTVAMIGGFSLFIYAGHVPLAALVLTLQILMVKELFVLARSQQKDFKLPGFRSQQWYFFGVAAFHLYLRFIKNNMLVELAASRTSAVFTWVLRHHTLLSYALYMAGFVSFVLSLKRGMYLYQFGQYGWTHMILLVIFVPSSFFISAIFEGLIWFLLPCALIIINDIMAYVAGFFWGRTPLIKLSPKKTWEGFIGGFVFTVISAYFLAEWFCKFKWFTCPREDLSLGPLDCSPADIYQPHVYTLDGLLGTLPEEGPLRQLADMVVGLLPQRAAAWLHTAQWRVEPMQLHAMVLAVFASIVSPFGGFFASGFKRAFKMKDFGDTIPGHGGVTDRFDCQMIMAIFAYLYYWSFVASPELTVGQALETVLRLRDAQQLELFGKLANVLAGEGLLPTHTLKSIEVALRAANIHVT